MALLTWMGLPGDAAQWSSLGFVVDGAHVRVGAVACTTGRVAAWAFDELHADSVALGVPTETTPRATGSAPVHPNGVEQVDHVVYTVPDLDAAVGALTAVL